VTGDDGQFALESVPPGTYGVEAFHSWYGWKRQPSVVVRSGETAEVSFSYSTADETTAENLGEATRMRR
jgi:hypothetical protein